MLNDFVTLLTTAILSSIPVTSAPAVTIDYSLVEQQVTSNLYSAQKKHFDVDCGAGSFVVPSGTVTSIICDASAVAGYTSNESLEAAEPKKVLFETEAKLNVKDLNNIEISVKVLEPEANKLQPKG